MALGQILDQSFSNLLYDIAGYFKINEQNDFESLEPGDPNLESHDFLKYIDLALALEDYVEIDREVAKRLYYNEKYKRYIKTNCGDDERDLDNPNDYAYLFKLENDYIKELFSENIFTIKYILVKH